MTATLPTDMTPAKYKAMRERLDTRRAVARALGVGHETLRLRESGRRAISREAGLALRFLAKHGLPAYLRSRPTREPPPERVEHGTPGQLREAFAILGWSGTQAAREILGDGESARTRMSRMMSGDRRIPEHVARQVKRRLGLELGDAWPERGPMKWERVEVGAEVRE